MEIKTLRWTARVLSAMILLIWGSLFLADLFGKNNHQGSSAIDFKDFSYLALMVISILGLVFAWKWELPGAIVALAAFIINAAINPRIMGLYIHFFIPALAIIYILVWWMSRVPLRDNKA